MHIQFIIKSDLRWCPTFSKLKTLLLNDYWCMPDHRALVCILEHSPVLEKLTLHLFSKGCNHKMGIKGSFSSIDRPAAISEHLKIVEIKSRFVDETVFEVLKFLSTLNISFSCADKRRRRILAANGFAVSRVKKMRG